MEQAIHLLPINYCKGLLGNYCKGLLGLTNTNRNQNIQRKGEKKEKHFRKMNE